MPDISILLLFAVAALALTASPGPDMLLIASRSATQGRVAGLATWTGIAAGTYCHALAAALGLSQLFLAVPVAYDAVRYAGAAYLLYLAWKTFTAKNHPPEGANAQHIRKEHTAWAMFRQGLLTNILNPKMVVFVLALFPQFVSPSSGSVVIQIMVLATVLNLIGLVINGLVIVSASRISRMLSGSGRIKNLSNYILGTVFAGLAMRLAFDNTK